VVEVFHEDGGFHDVAHLQTGLLNDGFDVIQRLAGLRLDVGGHFAGCRVDGNLS